MDIIGKKNYYFVLSLVILIPGLVALILWGLNLSIDFTGGSRLTLAFKDEVSEKTIQGVRKNLESQNIETYVLEKSDNLIFVRTSPISEDQDNKLISSLTKSLKDIQQKEFETIGPTIGKETTLNALKAVVIASILIVFYIAWSFRHVPKPASSIRFGVCAIVALIHDALVVVGIFAILGHFFGVEIDSLFVTAILTIIGFSVHDTIVVFDRIRENLRKMSDLTFSEVVNKSIIETLVRSLNTSLTVVLVLVSLLLFGGESIRWFVVALLIGIISGTYSSIFNASPFLVLWHELRSKKKNKI
ncbi:MAG: protein translocase subunit SecF [Candidatus Levybacteria bacterium]|nr:protein translocase subunit SecF [Candidatus Levybacteria bacterium]